MSQGVGAESALSGIPESLRRPLLDEYNKVAKHYREGRWEPAELNGGKLCEVVYCILKGYVDGALPTTPSKPSNMVDACRNLEKAAATFPRSVRIQIPRVLLALYEIRNNRNVGHVGADVDPNHMDASVVVAMVKWIMAELVRIFHGVSTEEASLIVEGLADRTIPIIWRVGDRQRVLGTDTSAKDKMLVLLYASAGGLPVRELVAFLEYGNASRFRTAIMMSAHKADLIDFDRAADTATISPVGMRYVEDNIRLEL